MVRYDEHVERASPRTYFLLDLQSIYSRGKLAKNLIRLLVELKLSGDQIGQVAQGLGGIKDLLQAILVPQKGFQGAKKRKSTRTYVLHHANSLLGLANKLIFGLLDLRTGILAQVVQVAVGTGLFASLDRVKHQAGVLNILARLSSEHQVSVKGGVPAGQEAGLDLSILGETSLANLLLGQSILFQGSCKRVLTLGALRECLGAGEGGTGDRVVEGLGLGLCGRRSCQGSLCLSGRGCLGQELDLLVDSTAQVIEGLADVGRVVVGLVGVLGAVHERWRRLAPVEKAMSGAESNRDYSRHLQQLLVDKLERIDALLKLDVFIGELGLVVGLAQLLLDHLLSTLRKRREVRTVRQKTTRQEDVSKATDHKSTGAEWYPQGKGAVTVDSPEVLSECLHSIHDWCILNF